MAKESPSILRNKPNLNTNEIDNEKYDIKK